MEKNEIFGEQPIHDDATSATNVGIDNLSPDNQLGSPLGKFKDVESLLTAYNNLQSEFTKKCQSLNELLKKQSSKDNVNNTPFYESENWQEQVDKFFETYPNAKQHAKAMANWLASDKTIMNSNSSLAEAYSAVLEDENKRLNHIINDKNRAIEMIGPEVKEKIINDYLKGLNKTSPFLIASKGGNDVIASYKKPINMKEAGEMAKKIFK